MNAATNPGTSKARAKAPKTVAETHSDLWADSLNHGASFPWYTPVATTGELVQLASAFHGLGGRDLIAEVEGL